MVEVAAQTTTQTPRRSFSVEPTRVQTRVDQATPTYCNNKWNILKIIHPFLPLLTTRTRLPPICALGDRSPRTPLVAPPPLSPFSRASGWTGAVDPRWRDAWVHAAPGGRERGGRSAAQNEHGQTALVQEKRSVAGEEAKGDIEIATLLEEAEEASLERTVPTSQVSSGKCCVVWCRAAAREAERCGSGETWGRTDTDRAWKMW